MLQSADRAPLEAASLRQPFFRIPPFPGAKVAQFNGGAVSQIPEVGEAARLISLIRNRRVGGAYWAAQPVLPETFVLARSPAAAKRAIAQSSGPVVLWTDAPVSNSGGEFTLVAGDCDPWHMLERAVALYADDIDDVALVAAVLEKQIVLPNELARTFGQPGSDADLVALMYEGAGLVDPFTGRTMTAAEVVALCGFWRDLIDSNRDIAGALGFAFWKRENVAPLLWSGSGSVPFEDASATSSSGTVAIWRSKVSDRLLALLEERPVRLMEVEDGFLRSQGLGADCIPPLSITADRLAAHFDPSRPSELELTIQNGIFDSELIERASALRTAIVNAGLGKYESGCEQLERPAGSRAHILVPGQVEDDRSVLAGGCGLTSNLELLQRVRRDSPGAYILYKPHPDVMAGHRKGSIPDKTCLEFADEILTDVPISSVIEMVDEVHVNTSLAGFEALMRGKAVTTYGVPFYAGWGLTQDRGPVPARRSAVRTVDELVAATLLLYPRYLDPLTGLPCPAEVVVQRLVDGATQKEGLVVSMRRLQGKFLRGIRQFAQ